VHVKIMRETNVMAALCTQHTDMGAVGLPQRSLLQLLKCSGLPGCPAGHHRAAFPVK